MRTAFNGIDAGAKVFEGGDHDDVNVRVDGLEFLD